MRNWKLNTVNTYPIRDYILNILVLKYKDLLINKHVNEKSIK